MIDPGHNFARKPRELTERCARHHFSGLFILVAVAQVTTDIKIGAMPPPTSHSMIERNNRTVAPYFLSMNAAAHTVTNIPTIIARMLVTKKLGITVKTRSVPNSKNLYIGPIASILMSLGGTLP